jgi:ferric-dicitrate binding protein FerR (iron transport regulator)
MEEDLKDIDIILLSKYLNKETDAEETLQVILWADASPEHKAILEKLKKAWDIATTGAGMQEWDVQKSKEEFLLRLIQYESTKAIQNKNHFTIRWRKAQRVIGYAAVILLLIGLPSLFFIQHYSKGANELTLENAFTTITAPKGSKSEMVLADGSKVWLNAGSSIKYRANFNKKDREVILEGEAYFDIAKNKNKPFLVHTSKITLRVLGTAFNVKSYRDENTIETTLIRGAVNVEKSEKDGSTSNYSLKPNQKAIYNKAKDEIKFYDLADKSVAKTSIEKTPLANETAKAEDKTEPVSTLVEQDISWKDGYFLVFDEPLESILTKVERRFDISVTFKTEAIKNLRYSGKIKESTPEQILEALKITSPIEYEMKGKQVVIWENLSRKDKFIKK